MNAYLAPGLAPCTLAASSINKARRRFRSECSEIFMASS